MSTRIPSARVKICGLSTEATLEVALEAGADWIGLVHFEKSPRHVGLTQAGQLSALARGRAERVLLLVDPGDALVSEVVERVDPDLIQLHGRESPERVAAIRHLSGRPVMKALGVAARSDLDAVAAYGRVADRLLLDAKALPGADMPGGNGRAFDWDLLRGADLPAGTMLSGGLTPETVAEAVRRTGLSAVDVSSGVEIRPGEKDPARIRAFAAALRPDR